jgi:TonB-linked SusC/RagA family outer membrane protein
MEKNYKHQLKNLVKYSLLGMLIQCFVFASVAFGATQQQQVTVSGTVVASGDQTGLPGVNVVIKGTTFGTTTDADGKYVIQIPNPDDAILVFTFIGYTTQEIPVSSQSEINVTLAADVQQLNEVVVVGYGTQQKVTLTGSVVNIKGDEMRQTKNENPQNMLTGRIAGVRVWQRSAEPGSYNNNFDIRGLGAPLVVIDGIIRSVQDFQRLNPADIDDISVLKDASAAIYGVRAANGVVIVTTKKGTKGKTSIAYNGSYTVQRPSGLPVLADPYQTMTLYNEKSMNNIAGGSIIYDAADFEAFRSGARRTTDWTKLVFADYVPQTQHDLSLSGGTDKTQYYVSMGYLFQDGFFKSGDLNYKKFNMRANITSELADGLTFNLNLSAMGDQRNTPYSSAVDIIRNYWRQGVLFPAYADADNTMLNYQGLDLEENTVAKEYADISGFHKYQQKLFQSSASLTYDFGKASDALKGLTIKGLFSYDYRTDENTAVRKEYYQYMYDDNSGLYNSKLYSASSPGQVQRALYAKQQWLAQTTLNYSRVFNTVHHVTGLLGLESQQRKGDNFSAQRNLAFNGDYLLSGVVNGQVATMSTDPADLYTIANEAMFGRLNYTFSDKYIIEGQFRYDGNSKFAKGHQWGFYPSGSVGWRLSEESFFKNVDALSFVSQLKFRASYGTMGDDVGTNYDWAVGYNYPATGGNAEAGYYNQYAPGYVFGGAFNYGATPLPIANPNSTWFTSKMLDIGMDFEAWNGLFAFTFDYFNRNRTGLYVNSQGELPTVVGAIAPRQNLNSDRSVGLDLEISHRNVIGDLKYKVKGIATVTRQKYLVGKDKGPWGNSYDAWRNDNLNNRYQGVQFGYEGAGRYTSWDDIYTYPIYKERDVLPGDYKYQDWNGDGQINGQDEHPYAYDQTPWVNFSTGVDLSYKAFDLNFLFQGTALGSMQYQEPLYSIWGTNGGGTLTQYLDRWHPVDPTADPYAPTTQWASGYYAYTGRYPIANSTFNRVSTAYLRLKSLEFGYTIPKTVRAFSTMNLRVFANAYNLFTITKVKFVDPEHPDDDLGRMYPLNKTYTVGISAKL